jgi:hypothetical protein
MPSVSSIFVALYQRSNQDQVEGNRMPFPSIDPMDTFYILNPDDKSINLDKTKEMLKLLNFKVFYMFKFNKHIKYGEN